ncbi:YdcF family protein [Clostridium sp. C2-6-12]|uniref:YdcF family protein n=1 Tax=Clostridium sp. C2-6-12 TaxID=2698832 RepID=UPI00136EF156|nr:YdcF family protein [Clostridium sp. C2-6-12]
MENNEIKYFINKISKFLAARCIPKLNSFDLEKAFGIKKVDILVLLGNSITHTIKCASYAYENNLCDRILINGGIGHSTEILRHQVRKDERYNYIQVDNRAEADIFFDIITKIYKVPENKIIVENQSTNCGDNALKAVKLLSELQISYNSLLLIQDPTMQLRTHASFKKHIKNEKVKIINYAPFIPEVDDDLKLINRDVEGIWEEKRFLELIMGEIPRLKDDVNGYGPCGKNFIAHVEVPSEIEEYYNRLKVLIVEYDLYGRCGH